MSDTVTMALIAGLPATLTALTGLIVSLKNGRKTDLVAQQVEAAATMTTQVVAKVDDAALKQHDIHVLVNSNLTKVKEDLADAKAEIHSLRALVTSLQAPRGES